MSSHFVDIDPEFAPRPGTALDMDLTRAKTAPPVTDAQLLRESLVALDDRLADVATLFYASLLGQHRELHPLFAHVDMDAQRGHLAAAIRLVAHGFDLDVMLAGLGRRHVGYGARPEHYPVVGETLVGTLCMVGGPAWTRAYSAAWERAIDHVAAVMTAAAGGAEVGKS